MANTDIRWKRRADNDQRAMRQLTAAVDGYRRHPVSELQQQGSSKASIHPESSLETCCRII